VAGFNHYKLSCFRDHCVSLYFVLIIVAVSSEGETMVTSDQQATTSEIDSASTSVTSEAIAPGEFSYDTATCETVDVTATGDSSTTASTNINVADDEETSVVSDLSSGAQLVFVVKKEPAKIGV